jgi:TPR repeat protein
MNKDGRGMPQDYKEAIRWFSLAAEQGSATQNDLGIMNENGQGMPQDYKEAIRWYRLAAEQGNAAALNNRRRLIKTQQVPLKVLLWHTLYTICLRLKTQKMSMRLPAIVLS